MCSESEEKKGLIIYLSRHAITPPKKEKKKLSKISVANDRSNRSRPVKRAKNNLNDEGRRPLGSKTIFTTIGQQKVRSKMEGKIQRGWKRVEAYGNGFTGFRVSKDQRYRPAGTVNFHIKRVGPGGCKIARK